MSRKLMLAIASLLIATPALAQDTGVMLDYRDAEFLLGQAFYAKSEVEGVADLLANAPDAVQDDLGKDFTIVGDSEGAFTKKNARQHLYLIQAQAAVALEPFPDEPAPVLLITEEGEAPIIHGLPEDVQFQRLPASADVDGDGLKDIVLETSFMNMGQSVTSLSVFSVGEEPRLIQTLDEVYFDGCGNPAGDKTKHAATITMADGKLVAENHELECAAEG